VWGSGKWVELSDFLDFLLMPYSCLPDAEKSIHLQILSCLSCCAICYAKNLLTDSQSGKRFPWADGHAQMWVTSWNWWVYDQSTYFVLWCWQKIVNTSVEIGKYHAVKISENICICSENTLDKEIRLSIWIGFIGLIWKQFKTL